jgi:hypothetical protein
LPSRVVAALASLDASGLDASALPAVFDFVSLCFEVLAAALSDHAANRAFVAEESFYALLAESLLRTGLLARPDSALAVARCVLAVFGLF